MSTHDSDGEKEVEFSFAEWISVNAISEPGKRNLGVAEIKDEQAIMLMDSPTLLTVKLAAGDFVKFKRGQQVLMDALDKLPALEKTDSNSVKVGENPGPSGSSGAKSVDLGSTGGPPLYTLEQLSAFLAGKTLGADPGISVTHPTSGLGISVTHPVDYLVVWGMAL